MALYIILGLIFVAACGAYFIFRRPPNRVVEYVVNLPAKDRALILIQATIWRLKFDAENPKYSGIYLDPSSFPRNVCERLFSDLLDAAFAINQNRLDLNARLRERGITDELPQDELFAVRVWGVTIGAHLGKTKLDDITRLWKSLDVSESPFREALIDLQHRQQARKALGNPGVFLEGFSVQQILQEATRLPQLSR
jgi:hypothetical protein